MCGSIKVLLTVALSAILATNIAVAGGNYGGHYRGYKHHGHHRYDSGDIGSALGLGLLFGAVLGHAMSQPRYDYYDPPRPYRSHRHHRRDYEYDQPRVVYREVAPTYRAAVPSNHCLQEREYQTTVVIGGKEVAAYGTACLQPDGSWRRGAAKLVPD